jgi:hypothetical protein
MQDFRRLHHGRPRRRSAFNHDQLQAEAAMKYTIGVDFDGVIHSYTSPWVAPHIISDPPVVGALEWLFRMSEKFDIAITSTRNQTWRGRWAMRRYLREQYMALDVGWHDIPIWFRDFICKNNSMEPWDHEVSNAAEEIVKRFKFPRHKPAALIYLDDRAYRFTGPTSWPTADAIHLAKPWNKP